MSKFDILLTSLLQESNNVFENPFIEGENEKDAVERITQRLKEIGKDKYQQRYIKFYHATDANLPIEDEGLLPTSANRRRSIQSSSGYVYLANTIDRAKTFGELGNPNKEIAVYEVIVDTRFLSADRDQLNNKRSVGYELGNSVVESMVYGGGIRVKGKIAPWQIKRVA